MKSPLGIRIDFLIGVVATILVAGLIACQKMAVLKAGVCGNAVIESGEDCDSFPLGNGTSCIPPGEANECRLSCKSTDSGESPKCPQGWGCGVDGICRASSGQYLRAGSATPVGAWSAKTGDFDGDGKKDVLTLGPIDLMGKTQTRIHYFNDQAEIDDSHIIITPMASPAVANLKSDFRDDLVSGIHGIVSWLGADDRKMLPVAVSSTDFKTRNVRIIPINEERFGWTMFIRADPDIGTVIDTSGATENIIMGNAELFNSLVADPAESEQQLVRWAPVYDRCKSFVVAFKGEKKVSVFSPCRVSGTGLEWIPNLGQVTITLPEPVESGTSFADIYNDNFFDLLVSIKTYSGQKVRIAYGDGNGHFASSTDLIVNPDDEVSPEFWNLTDAHTQVTADVTSLPLAGSQFGSELGFVFPTFMYMGLYGYSKQFYQNVNQNARGAWTKAIIKDINGDIIQDLIVSSSEHLDISIYNLTNRINDCYSLPTLGPVSHMVVTDVNGDSINDIVYSQLSPTGGRDALFVSFGQSGVPTAPEKFAELDSVAQIVPINNGVQVLNFPSDGGPDVQASMSQFIGTADHQLVSESFLHAQGRNNDTPLLITIGAFAGASVDLFCVAYETKNSNSVYHSWAALANGGQIGKPKELVDGGIPFLENETPVLITNADLNGDGAAEIILASYFSSSTSDKPSRGRIRIGGLSKVTAGLKWTHLGEISLAIPNLAPTLKGQLSATDLDGDGFIDIVLASGNGPLTIYWNAGNGQFYKRTALSQEGAFAFTQIHDQLHGPDTLAFTAKTSIARVRFHGDRTFESEILIDGLTAVTGITSGDFNGDGIEDIAVVDSQNLIILRGEKGLPVFP